MSIADEVGLTAVREITRNLRSSKGAAMAALFLLGGVGSSLVFLQTSKFFLRQAAENVGDLPPEALVEAKRKVLEQFVVPETATYLAPCPFSLLFLFKGTLAALPLLTLLIGFDTIAGETQHRQLRYLVPRARRSSLVVGKALGLWAVTVAMVAVLQLAVGGVLMTAGGEKPLVVLSWGARLWAFASVFAGAYVGLTTLISSMFRVPVVALFAGVGVQFALWVASLVVARVDAVASMVHVFPGTYDTWLVSHDPARVLGAFGVLLAWGAACVTLTSEIVSRRDV